MSLQAIGVATATVLAGLGVLHVHWAARGGEVSSAVVPEVDGRPAFRPTRAQTIAVAAALGTGAVLVAAAIGAPLGVPPLLARAGCGVMALVFAARAIGDFRLVGIFKRRRGPGTTFARWDDRAFTPLCAALAAAALRVALG